jgi:hypothetical protein
VDVVPTHFYDLAHAARGPRPAANSITGLHYYRIQPAKTKLAGCDQAGEAGPDNYNVMALCHRAFNPFSASPLRMIVLASSSAAVPPIASRVDRISYDLHDATTGSAALEHDGSFWSSRRITAVVGSESGRRWQGARTAISTRHVQSGFRSFVPPDMATRSLGTLDSFRVMQAEQQSSTEVVKRKRRQVVELLKQADSLCAANVLDRV